MMEFIFIAPLRVGYKFTWNHFVIRIYIDGNEETHPYVVKLNITFLANYFVGAYSCTPLW